MLYKTMQELHVVLSGMINACKLLETSIRNSYYLLIYLVSAYVAIEFCMTVDEVPHRYV